MHGGKIAAILDTYLQIQIYFENKFYGENGASDKLFLGIWLFANNCGRSENALYSWYTRTKNWYVYHQLSRKWH
jgi:hypothetical protein